MGFQRDQDLVERLYSKYGKSGPAGLTFRTSLYICYKKYSWILVTESAYLFKRLLDIVGSCALMTALSPVFLGTAFMIKLEDRGPVFFKQVRAGKRGKLFFMHKFRSMVVDADKMKDDLLSQNESGGVIFKMKHDPRITRVGRIIRKLSIDELPQLWNVLKGDMSLVGPRPAIQREVADYGVADRQRLEVIPGITGMWQVSGRSELTFKEQVSLDVQYIENFSFWGDIKILLKTVPAVLFGRGAY